MRLAFFLLVILIRFPLSGMLDGYIFEIRGIMKLTLGKKDFSFNKIVSCGDTSVLFDLKFY